MADQPGNNRQKMSLTAKKKRGLRLVKHAEAQGKNHGQPGASFRYPELNQRLITIPPSAIRQFFDIAEQEKDVISLALGEPDFVTPLNIRKRCVLALIDGNTHYTSNYGTLELREHIAIFLARKYGLKYDPKTEILITVGVSEGFDLATRALLNPGDEVLLPLPCYVMYAPLLTLAGAKVIPIPTRAENSWKLDLRQLESRITERTKMLVLNYPNNPTGATFTRVELEQLAHLIRQHNLVVVSDEVYAELTYDAEHTAMAALEGMFERVILLSGFSKYFAMTGLRVGYAAADKYYLGAMAKIHQYGILCAPTLSQLGAIEALEGGDEEILRMKEEYNARRKLIVQGLNDVGLSCHMPEGAFYVFPSVSPLGMTGEEFAWRVLREARVAVVPGVAFGPEYTDFVRLSYAAKRSAIEAALEKMRQFVARL